MTGKAKSKLTLKEAQRIVNEHRKEQQEKRQEKINKSAIKLIGTYWKYRNSYSCPRSDEDYWFLYVEITGFDKTELLTTEYQKDSYDRIEIKQQTRPCYNENPMEPYIKITKEEFMDATDELLTKMRLSRF